MTCYCWGTTPPMATRAPSCASPVPNPPISGARPLTATLRLYQFDEITQTVPLSVTVYRVNSAWTEAAANWTLDADKFAEAYQFGSLPAAPGR